MDRIDSKQRWKVHGFAVFALGLLVLVFYDRTVSYPFTNWDDIIYIINNPLIDRISIKNLFALLNPGDLPDGAPKEMIFIPLTYLSWMLEVAAFGKRASVFHATNVLLHLCNVLLVYALFVKLLKRPLPALVAAAAFAIHPIQVESVAWAMGRKDVLSAFFGLLCVLAYLLFLERSQRRWYHASLAFFVLAVLSKPSMIVLPGVLVLLDYRAHGDWLGGEWGNKIPFFVIMLVTYFLNAQMPTQSYPDAPSLSFRLLCVPWLTWHWAARFILASYTIPLYQWPDPDSWEVVAMKGIPSLLLFVGLLALAWKRGWNWLWQGMLAFGILFVPAIMIVLSYRSSFVTADRYLYFPLIPIYGIIGAALVVARGKLRIAAVGVIGLWLIAAAIKADSSVRVWRDSMSVWNRVLKAYPTHFEARMNRANTYAEREEFEKALVDFNRAYQLQPNNRQLLRNMIQFYQDWGKPVEAGKFCRKLGDTFEDNAKVALEWYRNALHFNPRDEEAQIAIRTVILLRDMTRIEKNPKDVEALINIGLVHEGKGNEDKAIAYLHRAAAIDSPYTADIHYHMGRIYLRQGKAVRGIRELRAALEIDPNHKEANRLLKKQQVR